MALKASAVGQRTEPIEHTVSPKDAILYALGVGATRKELPFLYEKLGPLVLPTYAVIPGFEANRALFDVLGGDMLGVVHGGQSIRLHRPFEAGDTLTTVGTVAGLYDLKRMASSVITTETKNSRGELVAETEWQILYRFDGGFGGPPPPRTARIRVPERDADFRIEETTSPEQALLYRLSGDWNPLHADPAIGEAAGFGGPILHGLCTYGYVGRAVLGAVCGGDISRFRSLSGQFRKPVWPGETLITEGWVDGSQVFLRVATRERPTEYVFSNAVAEVSE